MTELRKDPTRGRWVLVRPSPSGQNPADRCLFCPGNESLTPPEIAAYRKDGSVRDGPGWSVRVIPEGEPHFRIEQPLLREGVGLYDRITPRGASELIVESPAHDDTAGTLGEARWGEILSMYRERILDLKRDLSIRDILVTRRHPAGPAGSGAFHPVSRLTAIPIIFDDVRAKLRECREYFQYKRRCVYCDIIRQEVAAGERVVHLTDRFVALAPYAPRTPFETWVLPRQHGCAYEMALSPEAAAELGALLSGFFGTLRGPLGDPPFEMVLYSAPNQAAKVLPGEWGTITDDYHWHLEITPYPHQPAPVGGMYVNGVSPEEAAGRLRRLWE